MSHVTCGHLLPSVTKNVIMKYTVIEAAKIAGISRQTIYRHIDKKPISTEKDDEGNIFIDASELLRIYGDKLNFDVTKTKADNKENNEKLQTVTSSNSTDGIRIIEERLNSANKQIEMLETQMQREREMLEDQIGTLRSALEKSQDTQSKTVTLLEDKTSKNEKSAEWQSTLKALEERISNQEIGHKEQEQKAEKMRKQNKALQQALTEEKSKGFFKKVFG